MVKYFLQSHLYFSIFHYRRCQIAQKRLLIYISIVPLEHKLLFSKCKSEYVQINLHARIILILRENAIKYLQKEIILEWSKHVTYIVLHLSCPLIFSNNWTDCIAGERKSIKTKNKKKQFPPLYHFQYSEIAFRCKFPVQLSRWVPPLIWMVRQYSEFKAVIKWSFYYRLIFSKWFNTL